MSFITGFRTSIASSSRCALPPLPSAPSRAFSSTPIALASRDRKKRIKAKLDRHLAQKAARLAEEASHQPDPILGHVIRPDGTSPWDTCRLRQTLLRPEDVYNAPLTNFRAGDQPAHFLPGLGEEDKAILFGALPFTSVDIKSEIGRQAGEGLPSAVEERQRQMGLEEYRDLMGQENIKAEQMLRLMDLRNANKAGIEAVNRQRVIDEFGRKTEGAGLDTGSSEVQAALLTHKIRSLAEHLSANPKDNSNKRSLKSLVHKRQQVLKYYARKRPFRYESLLADLGLERRAVEGEISL